MLRRDRETRSGLNFEGFESALNALRPEEMEELEQYHPLKHTLQGKSEARTLQGEYVEYVGMHKTHSVGMSRNNQNSYLIG